MSNIWDNVQEEPPEEYKNLNEVIDFGEFKYDEDYREQERTVLQPQLERAGYKFVEWRDGERDCNGPRTRICRCFDPYGRPVWFVYG